MYNKRRKFSKHDSNTLIAKSFFALGNERLVELAVLCETPSSAQRQALNEGFYIEVTDKKGRIESTRNPNKEVNYLDICKLLPGAYAVYMLTKLKIDFPEIFEQLSEVQGVRKNMRGPEGQSIYFYSYNIYKRYRRFSHAMVPGFKDKQ